MGVDLSLKTLCRQIAGPHLPPQNPGFSCGNPHILALLMVVDLSLETVSGVDYRTSSGISDTQVF